MKTDPRILRDAAAKQTAVKLKKTMVKTTVRDTRLALVEKKTENRMIATAKRTAYLKQSREITARRMAAARTKENVADVVVENLVPVVDDAESMLPTNITNESLVDM